MKKEQKIEALEFIYDRIRIGHNTFICVAFEKYLNQVVGLDTNKNLRPCVFKRMFPELYDGIMEVGRANRGPKYQIGSSFIYRDDDYDDANSDRTFRLNFLKELLKKLAQ